MGRRSVCQVRIGKSEPSAGFGNPAGAGSPERESGRNGKEVRMPGSDWQIRTVCRIWQSGRSGEWEMGSCLAMDIN